MNWFERTLDITTKAIAVVVLIAAALVACWLVGVAVEYFNGWFR